MNYDNIKELIQIIDNSTLTKLELEFDSIVIRLEKQQSDIKITEQTTTNNLQINSEKDESDNSYIVTSPIVGTYYCSSSPTAKPFINVGDNVEIGDTLCIIEAMKIMNEITSQRKGTVVQILVENGQMVEYGQPLLKIL